MAPEPADVRQATRTFKANRTSSDWSTPRYADEHGRLNGHLVGDPGPWAASFAAEGRALLVAVLAVLAAEPAGLRLPPDASMAP
jgi:hypothetical protein